MLTLELDRAEHEKRQAERIKRFRLGFLGFWEETQAYMRVRTDLMFKKLRGGGTFRGQTWSPFKTATVARGGTHTGPSGRRVRNRVPASQASLIQDTGTLRRNILNSVFVKSPQKFTFGTRIKYAARQHALRPILFWEKRKDTTAIGKIAARWILTGKK